MKRLLANAVHMWCCSVHFHECICSLGASQQQQTSQPLTTSAQQARIEPPLACASLTVASEARLTGAVAGATTECAGGISAAASVVVGARVHGCKHIT
jgi:hypothetical protein